MPESDTLRQLWTTLTAEIATADLHRFGGFAETQAQWDEATKDLHGILADAVVTWVDLVVTAWNVGTIGPWFSEMQISTLTWPSPRS